MNQPIKIALFGAKGGMASEILQPLLSSGVQQLFLIEKDSTSSQITEALSCDVIVFAVPRTEIDLILANHTLSKQQLIIDISSYKKGLAKLIHGKGASLLSLHPMNGPTTPFPLQKWFVIGESPDNWYATEFLTLLRKKNVKIDSIASEEEHDRAMLLALSLPEFLSFLIKKLFADFGESLDTPSLQGLLRRSSPVFASLIKTYLHATYSSPLWLRRSLATSVDDGFLESISDKTSEFVQLMRNPSYLDNVLQSQSNNIKNIPPELEQLCRESVKDFFEATNDWAFNEPKEQPAALIVSKTIEKETLAALESYGRPVRVAIHGIKGSFSDEAWFRFAQNEMGWDTDKYTVDERVHAEKVLEAVTTGQSDIGIVAFANSGSGGYVASISSMGKFNFELVAMFSMPLNMCILAHPSVRTIVAINTFFGHPVALGQCRKTLAKKYPYIAVEPSTDEMDTALSAKMLASGEIPPTKAVFASERAADIYGLRILVNGAQHDPSNATAFAVIRRRT